MRSQEPKGVALLFTVIVVGVTGFAVMAFIARSGIASLRSSQQQQTSVTIEQELSGCIDEVIAQNLRDSAFNETSVFLGTTTCNIATVSESATEKTLELSITSDTTTKSVEITIGLDPVTLISIN